MSERNVVRAPEPKGPEYTNNYKEGDRVRVLDFNGGVIIGVVEWMNEAMVQVRTGEHTSFTTDRLHCHVEILAPEVPVPGRTPKPR